MQHILAVVYREPSLYQDIRYGKVYTATEAENTQPKQNKERTLGRTDITAQGPKCIKKESSRGRALWRADDAKWKDTITDEKKKHKDGNLSDK